MERKMKQDVINAKTLLAHAVKVEQDGYRFYLHLAKAMPDKAQMDLFFLLAEDELRHEQIFKKMVEDVTVGSFMENPRVEMILHGFLRDMDRFGSEQVLRGLRGELDREAMIRLAIQLEKDSILFYSTLKALVDKANLPVIEAIVDEELRHLSRLFAIRQGELSIAPPSVDDL
jgi:rubrerythrin